MNKNQNGVIEIDLMQMARAVLAKIWLVILLAAMGAVALFGYSTFMIDPTYESSALIYVNNSSISVGSASLSISSQDLTAAKTLVDTYIVILKSRNVLNDVVSEAGINMSYQTISEKVSASAENETEIFRVTVVDTDPNRAELIVNTICKVLPDKIAEIVDGSSVRIVDYGVVPSQKSAPSRSKYTAIGLLLGAVIAIGIIVVIELMDKVIRSEQYLTNTYPDIPILASIPDMSKSDGNGYYSYKKGNYGYGYGYGNYKNSEREGK